MNLRARRFLRVLGAAALAAAAPGPAAAREGPSWLERVPDETATHTYFVGQAQDALSQDAGREAAFKDAAAQIAGYIGARVEGRQLSWKGRLERHFAAMMATSASSRLSGARIVARYDRRLPADREGRRRFHVAILVEYPLAELRREKARVEDAERQLAQRQEALCGALAAKLARREGASVRVGDFVEGSSRQTRAFSRLLRSGLAACLAERGFTVLEQGPADLVIEGEYWRAADVEVLASARDAAGRAEASARVRLPLEAVAPAWLTDEEDEEDPFFASPQAPAATPKGAIAARSDPPGAQVIVDGMFRGLTPGEFKAIDVGPHSVQFVLEGYIPETQEVLVEPSASAGARVRLRRKTGFLSVHSIPEGAVVFLDGKASGKTPFQVELPTGKYGLRLELAEHKPWVSAVSIDYQDKVRRDPRLEEEDGALSIVVDPPGARLYLDDEYVGDSAAGRPLRLDPVSSGRHKVAARKDGREDREWTVRVRPRRTVAVSGAMGYAPFKPMELPKLSLPREPVFRRPERMYYLNAFGASFDGGGYYNLRALELGLYGLASTFGVGSSLVDVTHVDQWKVRRRAAPVAWYETPSPNAPGPVGFSMLSFFPVKLYFTPFAHAFGEGPNAPVTSLQLYSSFCFWALPQIPGTTDSDNNNDLPAGSVVDYGVLFHLGALAGVRVGVVEARIPGFTYLQDEYAAFRDRRVYVAADLSLGMFLAQEK